MNVVANRMPAGSRQVLVVQGLLHGHVFSSFPDSGAGVDFNHSFDSACQMNLQDATSHSRAGVLDKCDFVA